MHQKTHCFIVGGKFLHGNIRRQANRGSAVLDIFVKITEFMNPYKVKGVAQNTAHRVCCMIGVGKFSVFIDNKSCGGTAVDVGISVRTGTLGIYFGYQLLNCFVNVITAAECAYHTFFCRWVFLLFQQTFFRFDCPG